MKAFSEKGDTILLSLLNQQTLDWDRFSALTGLKKGDVILSFLKDNKQFIDYTDQEIHLTPKGRSFISKTSFVEQRDVHSA